MIKFFTFIQYIFCSHFLLFFLFRCLNFDLTNYLSIGLSLLKFTSAFLISYFLFWQRISELPTKS